MSTKPLKSWLSFSDQLALLESRGLEVNNRASALDYLERLGYYRLSGYLYPLRAFDPVASAAENKAVRSDFFTEGARFEDAVRLYVFDKKLRLLALDALERIEMSVRADVAHLLGERDPLAHQNAHCLHGNFAKKIIAKGLGKGKTAHALWLEKHASLLQRVKREPFVAHHQAQYGDLPIWVAIEVWDFGQLSKLFAGMLYADQEIIGKPYGAPNGKAFSQWLRSLNFIRNVAAHHSRLWNINVLELSPAPKNWLPLSNARPFFYFCLMQALLKVICPNSKWGDRFKILLREEFPKMNNPQISLADFGLVPDWEKWDLWQHK